MLGIGTGAWSSSNELVATVDNAGLVTAEGAGTCNIIYTITGGCNGTASAQKSLTVDPSSAITSVTGGTTPLCLGGTTTPVDETIWTSITPNELGVNDGGVPVELGVKFKSTVDGVIKGIRFYKGSALNTGTHTGTLWTSAGGLLATATFTGETSTGWQEVLFTTPVNITANTTYVASYFIPNGYYSRTHDYFYSDYSNGGSLIALEDIVSGGNGVFKYNATSAFPDGNFGEPNYWVDVVFAANVAAPGTTTCTANGVVLGGGTGAWSSTNEAVATVNNAGVVTAVGAGTTNITYTITGGCNGPVSKFQSITIVDDAPVITCPADVILPVNTGCTYVGAIGTATATDDCPVAGEITITNNAPAVFPVGNTTVTWKAVDESGNSATCTQLVTVVDNILPTITCPGNVSVNNDLGACGATVTYSVTSTDNCPGQTVAQTAGLASGSVFPIGTTTNTFVVTDASGNTATCSFNVVVTDNELPTITCPGNINVNNDLGVCGATVTYSVTSTDNCPGQTVAQTAGLASGSVFPMGTTTNTFVVTDASGNTATCSFNVVVTDNELPTITCPGNVSVNNDLGACGATVTYSVTSTDNCPGQTVAQTAGLASGSVFPIGTTTNTFVVTDASGNTATCSFNVVVTDNELPTITCPGNVSVNNDLGVCGATVTYSVTSTDNCPGQTVAQTAGLASGSVFPMGTTTNTFVVTDASGNTATCSFNVVVTDNELPTITCPGNVSVNNDLGACGATVTYSVTSTDNCPGQTVTQTAGLASGSVFPIGQQPTHLL